MEIHVEIDKGAETLRFTPKDDLVMTAHLFYERVGPITGLNCPHMNSQCVTSRFVMHMCSMLIAEDLWDAEQHRGALQYAQMMRFAAKGLDGSDVQGTLQTLASQRYDAGAMLFAGVVADSDKITHHGYDRAYWRFLPPQSMNVAILEIGLAAGASLRMWRALYPTARIVGVDIVAAEDEAEPEPLTTVLRGDQSRMETLLKCARWVPEGYDLIVDDGSHIPEHQLLAFRNLFTSLKPGGVYVIEDVETSYWGAGSELYGRITSGMSIVEIFKAYLDVVNLEISGRQAMSFGFDSEIDSITFAHNAIIITRALKVDVELFGSRRYRYDDHENIFNIETPKISRHDAFGSEVASQDPPLILFTLRDFAFSSMFQFADALQLAAREINRDVAQVFGTRALDATLSASNDTALVLILIGHHRNARTTASVLRKHAAHCSVIVYETEPLETAKSSGSQRAAALRDHYSSFGHLPTVWTFSHRNRRELLEHGLDELGLRAVTWLPPGYSEVYDYRRHPQRSELTRCSPVAIFTGALQERRLHDLGLPEVIPTSGASSHHEWAATAGSHHAAVNVHNEASMLSLEVFRLAPLLSSGLLVVSEHADAEDEEAFKGLVHFASSAELIEHLRALRSPICGTPGSVADEAAQTLFAARVSGEFQRRFNLTENLRQALAELPP